MGQQCSSSKSKNQMMIKMITQLTQEKQKLYKRKRNSQNEGRSILQHDYIKILIIILYNFIYIVFLTIK